MKKKLLSMILAICLLLSVVPVMGITASAENESSVFGEDISLTLTEDIEVDDTAADIAEKIGGYDTDKMTLSVELSDLVGSPADKIEALDTSYCFTIYLEMTGTKNFDAEWFYDDNSEHYATYETYYGKYKYNVTLSGKTPDNTYCGYVDDTYGDFVYYDTVKPDNDNFTKMMIQYFSLVPSSLTVTLNPVCEINGTKYTTIAVALASDHTGETEQNPTVIRMIANDSENVTIPAKRFITLDLNGHVLSGTGSGSVITNNGTLTIQDSNPTQEHYFNYVQDGAWTYYGDTEPTTGDIRTQDTIDSDTDYVKILGGCITGGGDAGGGGIYNRGTLTMNGGNIVGNSVTDDGGGMYLQTDSKANLYNVSLLGNNADKTGGAVFMNWSKTGFSSLLMEDCTVKYNTAENYGGGIYVCDGTSCKLVLLGTNIQHNQVGKNGGGVYCCGSQCFASGTQITMADGTTKAIEDITEGDAVKTFDHEAGCVSNAKVYLVYKGESEAVPFTLNFDNGKTLSIAGCHDLLEQSARKYVTLTEENAEDYIGKYFYAEDGWHKLVSVTAETSACEYYSIYTAEHQNCFANGFLSVPDDVDYLLNIYELDESLKADAAQLQADIDEYGLYSYEYVHNKYGMGEEWYNVSGAKYNPVAIGKGLVTLEYLEQLCATVNDAPTLANAPAPTLASAEPSLLDASTTVDNFDKGFTIGSSTIITENTANAKTENVYLEAGAEITLTGNSRTGISVGVTTKTEPAADTPVQITTNGAETDAKYFFSDYAFYGVEYNDNGYLQLAAATYSASLTLNEKIDLNFKIKNLGNLDKSKLSITVGSGSDNANPTAWTGYTITDGVLSGTLKTLAPYEVGDVLHIVVTYDNTTIKEFNYSAKAYCEKAITVNKSTQLTDLCKALLNYGKYAEDYYKNSTESTVNENYSIDFSSYTITNVPESKTILGGYADKGSSVSLEIAETIKLKFELKDCKVTLINDPMDDQTFFVLNGDGKQIDPERVCVDGSTVSVDLYASQLATSYTLKLEGVDTKEFCITYGVYNYCKDAQTMDSTKYPAFTDTLKTLCKAIYVYGEAVKAYNG